MMTAIVAILCCFSAAHAADAMLSHGELTAMLQKLISQGQSPDHALAENIVRGIGSEPAGAYMEIVSGMRRAGTNDDALAIYVWALGYTKVPLAVGDISGLLHKKRSLRMRINAWAALSQIGGDDAGAALLSEYEKTASAEERSYILWKMAGMRYSPALGLGRDLLKADPTKELWRAIFVYANFDSDSLPALKKSLSSKNRNERYSAALLLGNWLLLADSGEALRAAYKKEADPVVRLAILGSLERVMADRAALDAFMADAASGDPAEEVKEFANEYMERSRLIRNGIFAAKSSRKMDRDAFQREFEALYKSAGAYGDYAALGKASGLLDEPDLLRLRRAVLARENDASLEDYQKINEIIITNRLIEHYSGR